LYRQKNRIVFFLCLPKDIKIQILRNSWRYINLLWIDLPNLSLKESSSEKFGHNWNNLNANKKKKTGIYTFKHHLPPSPLPTSFPGSGRERPWERGWPPARSSLRNEIDRLGLGSRMGASWKESWLRSEYGILQLLLANGFVGLCLAVFSDMANQADLTLYVKVLYFFQRTAFVFWCK